MHPLLGDPVPVLAQAYGITLRVSQAAFSHLRHVPCTSVNTTTSTVCSVVPPSTHTFNQDGWGPKHRGASVNMLTEWVAGGSVSTGALWLSCYHSLHGWTPLCPAESSQVSCQHRHQVEKDVLWHPLALLPLEECECELWAVLLVSRHHPRIALLHCTMAGWQEESGAVCGRLLQYLAGRHSAATVLPFA